MNDKNILSEYGDAVGVPWPSGQLVRVIIKPRTAGDSLLTSDERLILQLHNEILKLTNQWLPIETAPKDGTVMDLWVAGERMIKCRYSCDYSCWHRLAGKYLFPVVGEITHYMIVKPPEDM